MASSSKPSTILLLTVSQVPSQFPLTSDFLYSSFSICGPLNLIYIFEHGTTTKAYIQYQNLPDANEAKSKMQDQVLTPWGGKISISFADISQQDLELLANSSLTKKSTPPLPQQLSSLKLGEFALKDIFQDEHETQLQDEKGLQFLFKASTFASEDQEVQKSLMKFLDDEYEKDAQLYSQVPNSVKIDDTGQNEFLHRYVQTMEEMKQKSQTEIDTQIMRNQSDPVHKYAYRNDEIDHLLDDEDQQDDASGIQKTQPEQFKLSSPFHNFEIGLILNQTKSKQLLVSNLRSDQMNSQIIYNLFSNFGNISHIRFLKAKHQAFILYTSNEFASIAKDLLNNLTFFDHQVPPTSHTYLSQLRIFFSSDELPNEKTADSLIVPAQYYRFRIKKQIYINCPSPVLHLSNLNKTASIHSITNLFSKAGAVKGTKLLKSDQDKIMVLVEMTNLKFSMKAIGLFHNYELDGKKIQISFTKSSLSEYQ